MNPVACFILRQKTRPSEDEGTRLMTEYLLVHHVDEFLGAATDESTPGHTKFYLSNPIPEADVNDVFDQFVRSSGGGRYLDDEASFHVAVHDLVSGDPPEPTKMAFVFARSTEELPSAGAPPSETDPFMKRGERFEALGRWGDAAQSYCIAMKLHGTHPELQFRAGRALLHHPRELGVTVAFLRPAADALPTRADVRTALGRCYAIVAANEALPVQGASREELGAMAISQLEAAARLAPGNSEIAKELATLRAKGGDKQQDSFFD